MESEKTNFMIANERQRVLEKEAETIRRQEIIKAETEAQVSKINKEREINEHESKKRIQQIESNFLFNILDQIYLDREKTIADAESYRITKEIEANNKKLTPEYLKYMSIISLTNNTKFYFGESIPKYLTTNIESDKFEIKKNNF